MTILNLSLFLNILNETLNPSINSQFYNTNAERKWEALNTFLNNTKTWLYENHIRVHQIVFDVIDNYICEPLTNEQLQKMNAEIQEKAKWFVYKGE